MSVYIIPVFVLFVFVYARFKKVNVFKSFTTGGTKAVPLVIDILPVLVAIFIMLSLMAAAGVDDFLARLLSPVLSLVGIPKDLALLVIMRPLSGSGSLAVMQDIMAIHGADSYIGRAACVVTASADTLLYIATLYLTKTKVKRLGWTLPLGFAVSIFSSLVACWICRIL